MILLAIGAGLVWRSAGRAPAAEYAAAAGAGRELRLADGTRVRLGGASVLTVAAGYNASAREVAVRGDAYFEVVHDERRPFIVRTPDAVVHDLGTAFTVRADSGAGTRVVVTSGVVTLAVPGGRPDTLRAGDRGRTHAAGVLVERGAATGDDVAWTRGEIVFRDLPLAAAAAELRRWYGVTVEVDPALARRRITASFDSAQKLDEVLGVLAATVGGRVERRGGRALNTPARWRGGSGARRPPRGSSPARRPLRVRPGHRARAPPPPPPAAPGRPRWTAPSPCARATFRCATRWTASPPRRG
ncbi:MAG: FecR domain-containing protein [Gemmatimonadetes bacterium]|nr:FecR domain-containing protein [Gemmatimonadota bacterium]